MTEPVTALRGVGPALAAKLERLGLRTVQDLLFHLPVRYEDRTRIVPIATLTRGTRAVIEGEIALSESVIRRRRALLVRLADGSGAITLRFFHFSQAQQRSLARGVRLRCYGEARTGPAGLEIVHPEYRVLGDGPPAEEEYLTPIYATTEGVAQARLRALIGQALERVRADSLPELIPAALRSAHELPDLPDLPGLIDALQTLHRPPPESGPELLAAGRHPAQRRLAFEELLAHHLSLRVLREQVRCEPAPAIATSVTLRDALLETLAFELTAAQARVLEEIEADLARPEPMLRLVQGDVGSGKTIVAVAAAMSAVEAGLQSALMAPTELLAEQHCLTVHGWLDPLGLQLACLTGKLRAPARRQALADIAGGTAVLAVGTHALFQQAVEFARLGLVITDEQHRFGVHQRFALREKGREAGTVPHQLIMTATPIPRTLAMTAYADLDVSVIDELPPGRRPVQTVVVPATRREEVVRRVREACIAGRQAYWVCPLIEESELLEAQAAEELAALLREALPELEVALVHGRMRGAEKETVMTRFKAAKIDLLVATTVIEVGVDVPNASLMIVENAERMGLAQLHQLRGRVGRGTAESSCVLLYQTPLSQLARERLRVLRETNDGFVVARKDLELRGPGEVLGTRQSGLMQMRIADLLRDADLLPAVHKVAAQMLREHRADAEALIGRWTGDASRFASV